MYIQYGVLACACLPAPGTVAGTTDDDEGGGATMWRLPARPARAPATSCCITVLRPRPPLVRSVVPRVSRTRFLVSRGYPRYETPLSGALRLV